VIEGGGIAGGYIVPRGSTVPGRRPLVAGPEVPRGVGAGVGTMTGETVGEVTEVRVVSVVDIGDALRRVVLGLSVRA
jgi:hypothetical protein